MISHLLATIESLETEHHWGLLKSPPAHPAPPPPGAVSRHHAQHVLRVCNAGLWLVETDHMTWILTSDWSDPSGLKESFFALLNTCILWILINLNSRDYGHTVHQRSTIKLLLRGETGQASVWAGQRAGPWDYASSYWHPQRFKKHNYTTPTYRDISNTVIWGIVRTGYRFQMSHNPFESRSMTQNAMRLMFNFQAWTKGVQWDTQNTPAAVLQDQGGLSVQEHDRSEWGEWSDYYYWDWDFILREAEML